MFRHLDVGSSFPGVVSDAKGAAVLRIIRNVSWVHTVVRQVGFYLLNDYRNKKLCFSTRGLNKVNL
jgi:hypothetical protein